MFEVVTRALGTAKLFAVKHAPLITVSAGTAGLIASGVWACYESTKLNDTLLLCKQKKDMLKQWTDPEAEYHKDLVESGYTDKDYKKDLAITYAQNAVSIVKLYIGPALLCAVSTAFIFKGYSILNKRNLALTAAYKALDEGFKRYRTRVREKYGDEVDRNLYYGFESEYEIDTIDHDEDGKEVFGKEKEFVLSSELSPYCVLFDESNPNWVKDPSLNRLFLKSVESECNRLFIERGHIFLNEVQDALGMPRTSAGQIVGWVHGNGDNYIDFGVYNIRNKNFINGTERCVLLDFNVDGIIYDKI